MKKFFAQIVCLVAVLAYTGCKKEEVGVVLFPVALTDAHIIFENTTTDTAFLDFALVRISEARTTTGVLNDGFVLDTATSPVTLLPGIETTVMKNAFVYKTDTLRNADVALRMVYNVRYAAVGDTARRVEVFSKNF